MSDPAETRLAEKARLLRLGRGSLRDDVRQYLRDAIIQGDLKPGEKIAEARLARELGLSQAPIREALRELEHVGLVVNHSHKGTFVRKITGRDAWEMYTLRAELEGMAARLALPELGPADYERLDDFIVQMVRVATAGSSDEFTQIDVVFHRFICERSGHTLLLRTWQSINPLNWTAVTVATLKHRTLSELAARHRAIVDAFRRGDVAEVESVMKDHVLALASEVRRDLDAADQGGATTAPTFPAS